jgi:hypothetical protein
VRRQQQLDVAGERPVIRLETPARSRPQPLTLLVRRRVLMCLKEDTMNALILCTAAALNIFSMPAGNVVVG